MYNHDLNRVVVTLKISQRRVFETQGFSREYLAELSNNNNINTGEQDEHR